MSWDDNPESGGVSFLVLMQGEGAATYSHDLTGERQADAAAFLLCGEEWDEDMGSNVVGDETGVIDHVDDDGFLLVGVCFDLDVWILCKGTIFRFISFFRFISSCGEIL